MQHIPHIIKHRPTVGIMHSAYIANSTADVRCQLGEISHKN